MPGPRFVPDRFGRSSSSCRSATRRGSVHRGSIRAGTDDQVHNRVPSPCGFCERSSRACPTYWARKIFGEAAEAKFPHRAVHEGDEIKLGRVILRFIETPGHTPESISILVIDKEVSPEPLKVLTGDTLFIGDVGRPDLAGGKGYTPQAMAEMLYDSLHEKLLKLPDSVEVFPAHGAGSMCGRNISQETSSTIGEQKKLNYALKPMTKEAFVKLMTTDLPEAPAYFPRDAEINRIGAEYFSLFRVHLLFHLTMSSDCLRQDMLCWMFVRLRISVPAIYPAQSTSDSEASLRCGPVHSIALSASLIIVAESAEQVDEAVTRLARVGIENVKGYLDGGMRSWNKAALEVSTVPQISVDDLNHLLEEEKEPLQVLDVRRPPEYQSGHVPRALSVPLSVLRERISNLALDPAKATAVICAGGYRSSAATSLLEQKGFRDLRNVIGGTMRRSMPG